jgi:hypothetical protein
MTYQKGDAIVVICDDQTVEAEVLMISENQSAALIGFEAIFNGHVGRMPLLLQDAERGVYQSMDGTEITIRRKLSS